MDTTQSPPTDGQMVAVHDDANALEAASPPPRDWRENPVVRQLAVMVGIALSVAIGVAVVLWSRTPSYSMLFANLAQKDASEILQALQQAGVDYRVDESSGALLVPSSKLQQVRLKLAAQGLPRTKASGYELLDKDPGFGTSRLIEKARYQRALEGELARTIRQIAAIDSARVHIARPRQSVFVRERKPPSASVVVKLLNGRVLEKSQVAAIVHLVASAVPELESSRVTVVDQRGKLLSGLGDDRDMLLTATQFDYVRKLEKHYQRQIEDILKPVLGADAVRAQVTADVDFSKTEQTVEQYNPDQPALRSEQLNEQQSRVNPVQGVPGALSNQPPAATQTPEVAKDGAGGADEKTLNSTRRSVRNYELDRTLRHTRRSPYQLRRLSVAVVVDDLRVPMEDGKVARQPRSPEQMENIRQLVRNTIGFEASRGDSVRVINASFQPPEAIEPLPEPPLWKQPWFIDLARQGVGALVVLVLILTVLRPAMKRLVSPPMPPEAGNDDEADEDDGEGIRGELDESGNPVALGPDGEPLALEEGGEGEDRERLRLGGPRGYEETLEAVRELVREDPGRVAQLIKVWVAEE